MNNEQEKEKEDTISFLEALHQRNTRPDGWAMRGGQETLNHAMFGGGYQIGDAREQAGLWGAPVTESGSGLLHSNYAVDGQMTDRSPLSAAPPPGFSPLHTAVPVAASGAEEVEVPISDLLSLLQGGGPSSNREWYN